MQRTFAVLAVLLAASASAACGQQKKEAPRKPAAAPAAPVATKKPEPPPPPLSVQQKIQIEADFQAARAVVEKARQHRLAGERIEREKGPQLAAEELGRARKLYREAAQMTEKWVEPELNEVSQRQLDADVLLKGYFDERGGWIKEDASMGAKLNVK